MSPNQKAMESPLPHANEFDFFYPMFNDFREIHPS